MRALAVVLALSGCAELRSGWVHVEFEHGKVDPLMICKFDRRRNPADGEQEIVGACMPIRRGR